MTSKGKWLAPVSGAALLSMLVTAGGVSAGAQLTTSARGLHSLAGTTITLEGPNQWNSSGSSFGKPWNRLVASFKNATGITVKTTVLPLASFNQTESTQLAAGTAPDLVFNQATYKPYMVHHLQKALKKPNPFVPGNKKWISLFRSKYYGLTNSNSIDAQGNVNAVPFNLVATGIFTNEKAFKKAGVSAPIKTWSDFINACHRFRKAGYTPFAMDDSSIGTGWTETAIFNMLATGQGWYKRLNVYNAAGGPGHNPQLTAKDVTRAVALGIWKSNMPIMTETLKLMKQMYDNCVTKNWSGIAGTSGAVVGLQQFASGKAAMAWGVDFGYGVVASTPFKVGSMPFPTVTSATTHLSKNAPAEWGASTGGTDYMIPSNVSGKKYEASLRFLQFVSSPRHIQAWLNATGGVPAVKGATAPPATSGFVSGPWSNTQKVGGGPGAPPTVQTVTEYDTFLLGDRSLASEEAHLETLWEQGASYNVDNDGWQSASWAKRIKS